ncbi:MAG: hypothetical protein MSA89_14525 [Clostridium sp.]|nr:hypothetical protein [Clostridium sp.]MCI7444272.1 hypothetical protein [Clostridium sp.]
MNKKKLTCLILSLGLSLSLAGCGCGKNNDGNNTVGNVIENGADTVGDAVKDVGEGAANIVDNITDTTMDYNASDFRRDLEKSGAKVEETEASQSYFSIDNKDYTIDGERISVYEYDEDDATTLRNDLSTVTNNGTTINNKDVKWNKKAHIYKKGRIVVVYDGDNEKVLKVLNDTLGNSLLK